MTLATGTRLGAYEIEMVAGRRAFDGPSRAETRVAFRGVRDQGGQRDLWTVAAEGGTPLEVTNDTAVDWNPAWSPDGRYLHFSSGRGGAMNLWRVAIDEASGRRLGTPEPMTAPALWAGDISLSRDGHHRAEPCRWVSPVAAASPGTSAGSVSNTRRPKGTSG